MVLTIKVPKSDGRNRGAGNSSGRTSWTGNPELADFESVLAFLVCYLLQVQTLLIGTEETVEPQVLKIILGGYSFGSSLVSRLPPADELLQKCLEAEQDSWRSKVRSQARSLAVEHLGVQTEHQHLTNIEYMMSTYILLVSPLLPPVTVFVAPLALRSFRAPSLYDQQLLIRHPTLALFGDKDSFTSSTKLQHWGRRLQEVDSSKFRYDMIHDADHFWRSKGAVASLCRKLQKWLQEAVNGS